MAIPTYGVFFMRYFRFIKRKRNPIWLCLTNIIQSAIIKLSYFKKIFGHKVIIRNIKASRMCPIVEKSSLSAWYPSMASYKRKRH